MTPTFSRTRHTIKDLIADTGFDPGSPVDVPEPELIIEACLLGPIGEDPDCGENLSVARVWRK